MVARFENFRRDSAGHYHRVACGGGARAAICFEREDSVEV
jgi:hypothetical protein